MELVTMLDNSVLNADGIAGVSMQTGQIHAAPGRSTDIAEDARRRLRASTHSGALRGLHCEHNGGELVLRGRVSSYYHKQLAQEAVRDLRGVDVIRNAVEVFCPTPKEVS